MAGREKRGRVEGGGLDKAGVMEEEEQEDQEGVFKE